MLEENLRELYHGKTHEVRQGLKTQSMCEPNWGLRGERREKIPILQPDHPTLLFVIQPIEPKVF